MEIRNDVYPECIKDREPADAERVGTWHTRERQRQAMRELRCEVAKMEEDDDE